MLHIGRLFVLYIYTSLYLRKSTIMIRRFLLPVFLVVATLASAYTLQGTIVTTDRNPMPGASVVLFATSNDSVPVAGPGQAATNRGPICCKPTEVLTACALLS